MTPIDIAGTAGSSGGLQSNPFVMLTFIVAPAVLTNACAILAMSTSNRFARAIDRVRELTAKIDKNEETFPSEIEGLVDELAISETRALLLVRSLRSFYWSMASFALVALVALLGAILTTITPVAIDLIFLVFVLLLGFSAVGGLVYGSVLLLRETQMVVSIIQDRINVIKSRQWQNQTK